MNPYSQLGVVEAAPAYSQQKSKREQLGDNLHLDEPLPYIMTNN